MLLGDAERMGELHLREAPFTAQHGDALSELAVEGLFVGCHGLQRSDRLLLAHRVTLFSPTGC